MAIDTRQKRRSMINCRFGWGRMMAPIADGTIGQADRQFIPGRYAGILWNPVGPTDSDAYIIRELRIDGDDLVVSFSLIDSNNDAIIAAQNISFSILRLSDNNYYNVLSNDFDLASEPSLINAPHVDDGVWECTLTNGYATRHDNYRIHIEAAGPYTGNYGFVKSLNLDTLLSQFASTLGVIRAQGFRRERVTREEIMKSIKQVLIETRQIKKEAARKGVH